MRRYFPIIFIFVLLGLFTYYEYSLRRTPPTLEPEPARAGVSFLYSEPIVDGETAYLVDRDELVSGGINRDAIPALTDPNYESIFAADTHLSDDGFGIYIEVSGEHYFYPEVIMSWHELVNDTLADKPLLITYCPLCRSSVVYESQINDQVYQFGSSGLLLNNNSIMYDRETESLWPQLLGTAVAGEMIGQELVQYRSKRITFREFKENYVYGSVLSRETGYDRDYTQDPYQMHYDTEVIPFSLSVLDGRLDPKQIIYGEHDGTVSAIAHETQADNSIASYWYCWVAAYPGTEL